MLFSRHGSNPAAVASSLTPVYTFDGKLIGHLASQDATEIRVAHRRSEFALPGILVRQVSDNAITLHVDQAGVARYRRNTVAAPHTTARIANATVTLAIGLLTFVLR